MWRSTFVAETIFGRSILLAPVVQTLDSAIQRLNNRGVKQTDRRRVGWSKLIQTNLNEPDVDLSMNLTHQVWFVS